MKVILVLLLSISALANIQSYKYKFTYQSFDGQVVTPCTFSPINEWYDYEVKCGKKLFSVHLLARKHHRTYTPKTTIEVLYWINNKSVQGKIEGSGASMWYNLNEKTGFQSITVSQSTDSDTAGLYLEIKPY